MNKELINYQDKLYYVYRKFKITDVKKDKIHELMKLLDCNMVVKKNTQQNDEYLYYLREIPELEIF